MTNPLEDALEQYGQIEFTKMLLEELEYLRHFYDRADFGPADGDVRMSIQEEYEGPIPKGYEYE